MFFVPEAYAYAVFLPLAEEAQNRGYEVAWYVAGCTTVGLPTAAKLFVKRKDAHAWRPDVVISCTRWCPPSLPGIKVMVFHGFPINKRALPTEKLGHFRIRNYYDLYCTMAALDTERYQQLADQHKNFRVVKTGWPRLDSLLRYRSEGEEVKHGTTPTLFYASTFTPRISSARAVADTLRSLHESGRWQIYATLHPKTDPETLSLYRSMADGDRFQFVEPGSNLAPYMAEADVALSDASSIIFELMFLDIPVVTFNTTMPGPHLIDVSRTDDVEPALRRALAKPAELMDAIRAERYQMHEFTDGYSSSRVLDAVEWFDTTGKKGLRSRRVDLLRRFKIWKNLKRREERQNSVYLTFSG